jgi:hypothetical protein
MRAYCAINVRHDDFSLFWSFALADRMELATPNVSRSFDNRGRDNFNGWSSVFRRTAFA